MSDEWPGSRAEESAAAPVTAEAGQLGHPDLVRRRPRLREEAIPVGPGLWTLFGVSLANCHVIEGTTGIVVVDAGHSEAEGRILKALIRRLTSRPIVGVLLTHGHYVHGIGPLVEGEKTEIVAHPDLIPGGGPAGLPAWNRRRFLLETGAALPPEGPDAVIAPATRWPGPSAFVPPTRRAVPGDRIELGGVRVDVLEGAFDTTDGLAFRFPDHDAVAHNLVVGQLPNFGSLGGGRFRDPLPWMRAVDALRASPPEHLLPCHGRPLSGRDAVAERLQVNLAAVRHLHRAVLEGLSRGATVPDLVRDVRLPEELARHPDLLELYGTVGHMVAAFANGEAGFWSGEVRDLLPLHPDEEAQRLAGLVGGAEALVAQAGVALRGGDLRWALHLADAAARLRSEEGGKMRAAVLRKAACRQSAWTVRNLMLSLAREDEARARHENDATRG
jgi:alkyl sulfatase BDS1-like metallo-beta-lactamase superfamily hydrolase